MFADWRTLYALYGRLFVLFFKIETDQLIELFAVLNKVQIIYLYFKIMSPISSTRNGVWQIFLSAITEF